MNFLKLHFKKNIVSIITLILIGILLSLPNPFKNDLYANTEKVKATVISIDNSQIKSSGLTNYGEQVCEIKIEQGIFKGEKTTAINNLNGQLEADKLFAIGDTAFVILDFQKDTITHALMIDHYRLNLELYLAIAFIIVLLLFARGIGFRSLLSFIFTLLMIWKFLIPCFLLGYNAIFIGVIVTLLNTIIIISLVYGFDKRSLAAILGAMAGIIVTGLLAIFFVSKFKIHGAIMSYSESLLYSGFQNINLTQIFTASIFIAASGAMMDVAVDISSAMHELTVHNPQITKRNLINSGFTIGRAVMGTMTTTLLLAYSGGYMGLMMVFLAQGTPLDNILNLKYVSSEILHTIIGSFGLVTVAPFTAIISGLLFTKKKKEECF